MEPCEILTSKANLEDNVKHASKTYSKSKITKKKMTTDRVINSKTEFEDVFSNFYMINSDFRKLILEEVISQGGYVTVDNRIDPKNQRWDGLLKIHFSTAPTSQEVVKIIKTASLPDDFGMNDNKTLWFWWD